MKEKITSKVSDLRLFWNIPMPGRYMTFKEIAAYAGGGIGAYFIITMGSTLVVSTNNMIISGAVGVSPTHMYLLYVLSTLINIPLTAIRANMIDNTRNKAGKYRPYLLSMGIPTALISLGFVWFPYDLLYKFEGQLFGYDTGYILKLVVVMIFNLLLQFFFNFFNDAYTNLIHVLSPNTQERTDVLSIKSVVYSLAPSIMNVLYPIVAKLVADNNLYDIRVYRYSYPAFAILGIALTVIIFGNTKEKIVQAKTRTVQVRFTDAFREVAKNKYFWIIALAGWLGFLEMAYANILNWSYSYGHTCEGGTFSLITLLVGNASLWGMILAPFCIKRWGKKRVLIGINMMNVICILAMGINMRSIIWLTVCIYINYLFGAFEQITTPAIQADIRDYHQHKTGERVDGMFATVATIGNVVTLLTSSVLPFVYEHYGIFEGNGYKLPYDILDVETGKPDLLYEVMGALIVMAAVGAFLNVVPYFFYDLTEKQQKGIVRVLKIRAMFEDYGNGVRNDRTLVEAIDIITNARKLVNEAPVELNKELKKQGRKAYRAAAERNEEIEIAKFVCEELEKFDNNPYKAKYEANLEVYNAGLMGLYNLNKADIQRELAQAKKLPKNERKEKEFRQFSIEIAKAKLNSVKAINKYFSNPEDFVQPDYTTLDSLYNKEDDCDDKMKMYYQMIEDSKSSAEKAEYKALIKSTKAEKAEIGKLIKAEMDKLAYFARAAKPYLDAQKIITEKENYTHLEELAGEYEQAKKRIEDALKAEIEEQKRLDAEKAAQKAAAKAKK